eukprot:3974403-Pleurochrysis_carterae.AAC.1
MWHSRWPYLPLRRNCAGQGDHHLRAVHQLPEREADACARRLRRRFTAAGVLMQRPALKPRGPKLTCQWPADPVLSFPSSRWSPRSFS